MTIIIKRLNTLFVFVLISTISAFSQEIDLIKAGIDPKAIGGIWKMTKVIEDGVVQSVDEEKVFSIKREGFILIYESLNLFSNTTVLVIESVLKMTTDRWRLNIKNPIKMHWDLRLKKEGYFDDKLKVIILEEEQEKRKNMIVLEVVEDPFDYSLEKKWKPIYTEKFVQRFLMLAK
jgi:hypothetical protein